MESVVGVLLGVVIFALGFGILRAFARSAPGATPVEAEAAAEEEALRVTFRCGACGTEVLLLRKGSNAPPRHCGEPMVRRAEIAGD
ncbi:MAG: hypothetical protein HY775_05910 [Acidobacteria bacterium]|nr:hypothetical protein [Acidobacteriota bacterium]